MTRIFAVSLIFLALAMTLADVCLTSRSHGDALPSEVADEPSVATAMAVRSNDSVDQQVPLHNSGKSDPDKDVKRLTVYLDRRGAAGISVDLAKQASSDVNPQRWQGNFNPLLSQSSAPPLAFGR